MTRSIILPITYDYLSSLITCSLDMPSDAQIKGIEFHDPSRRLIRFIVDSNGFEEVLEGQEMPWRLFKLRKED